MNKRKYTIYKDEAHEWRWSLHAGANNIRNCGEGYKNRNFCWDMLMDDARSVPYFCIVERKADNTEEILFDMDSAPIMPKALEQTHGLLKENMAYLRNTSAAKKRETLWERIYYLKSVIAALEELQQLKKEKGTKA